jgi:hypothetical protein
MKSSISRSAAWLIRPDLDPSWHASTEWAGLAHMLAGAAGRGSVCLVDARIGEEGSPLIEC